MSLAPLNAGDGMLFGSNIPENVNAFLQAAAMKPNDEAWAEMNLQQALAENPEQLEVYVALYKFYCYRGRFDEAEAMARMALAKAAAQAGLDSDWWALGPESADWSLFEGPARLLLYSLKALAFISLRQQRIQEAEEVLDLLLKLDPEDRVGSSVVRDMAAAILDDHH